VMSIGSTLPNPLGWIEQDRGQGQAAPLLPPLCCRSNPLSTPATARRCHRSSPPEPLRHCGNGCSRLRPP
jgi:hypothetical protein